MATADELEVRSGSPLGDRRLFEQSIVRQIGELRAEVEALKLSNPSGDSGASGKALTTVMAKTGASAEDALLLALTLYDIAIDATRQGQRLVLLDNEYRFVREVTGLTREVSESPSQEKVAG